MFQKRIGYQSEPEIGSDNYLLKKIKLDLPVSKRCFLP